MSWTDRAHAEAQRLRTEGRWRGTRAFDAAGPTGVLPDGSQVVAFASNDYLGLTAHPTVRAAAVDAVDRWGTGAGASRLVTGSRPVHSTLEAELAEWKRTQRSVLFASGFAANLGVLTVFGSPGTRILSDELNHASIVDGCRLARADVAVYRHGDVDHLRSLLPADRPAIVVSDTVFSMDGDEAPVEQLIGLCADRDALLVLDEAHDVFGTTTDFGDGAVLRVGTMSKMLASLGGFVAGPAALVDLLVNRARPFIFTTAPTPADTAAALAALRIVRAPEGAGLRARLRRHIDRLRPGHPSPILPVVLGSERSALEAADALLRQGILVPAIRPPTVPIGTSRLRVTLSAGHSDADVDRLRDALTGLRPRGPVGAPT